MEYDNAPTHAMIWPAPLAAGRICRVASRVDR